MKKLTAFLPEQNPRHQAILAREKAKSGKISSQCDVGRCYFYGSGVNQNIHEAILWFRKSKEHGHELSRILLFQVFELEEMTIL